MKRFILFMIALSLLVCPTWAEKKPVARQKASPPASKKASLAPVQEKQAPYQAFIVVEASTGRVLEGENIHKQQPPASITKLMLALLVLEKLEKNAIRLADMIPISEEASKMGGSQVYLKPGESFSLEDLMKAVMVASANDAAYAVSEFIAGSREEIVRLMNEKARELNMADTVFHSMHGLPPSKGQDPDLSSCFDLSLLARALLKYPLILEWTSIRRAPFRDGKFVMDNHNRLLQKLPGTDGLKTGYYREAGFSMVVTAARDGLRLIAVVMGSPQARVRDNAAIEKLRKGFAGWEMAVLVKKGDTIEKEIPVSGAKQKTLKGVAAGDFSYPVPRNKKANLKKEIVLPEKLNAEIALGQRLGDILIRFENETVGKVDIVSPVHIEKGGILERIFN